MSDVFELQSALTAAAGASGDEKAERELIARLTAPYCDEQYTDALGSLICHKKGPGKKVMVSGHMDAIGVYVRTIDEKGFIFCDRVGGLAPHTLVSKPVKFTNGTMGVVREVNKLEFWSKGSSEVTYDDIYIDIGTSSREETMKKVNIGDTATVCYPTVKLANNLIGTCYADDLCACIALILSLEDDVQPVNDMYYVFTTQEEVGCRGAQTAALVIGCDYGVAVDVNSAGDCPGQNGKNTLNKVGKGLSLTYRTAAAINDREFLDVLAELCDKNGIPYQTNAIARGGTDAGNMQKVNARTADIAIPTRYIHSAGEVYSADDIIGAAKLVTALSKTAL